MNKKLLLFLIFILYTSGFSQEWTRNKLDSLFNFYVNARNYSISEMPGNFLEDTTRIKCGFGAAAEIFLHFNEFTEPQKRVLKVFSARPATDASIVSPSGFFRIHYYSSGSFVPQYDINAFAQALDSSYNFEVNYLGYPPPPEDTQPGVLPDSAGGDNRYDIYIIPLGNLYGETFFETQIGNDSRWTSYIEVDYKFGSGFYTHGIDAARVTAAHEFHHSIQVGNYIYRDADLFFYELTSTSMEEFVFDTVNDYYAYMSDYFRNTDRALAENNGYNLAIWNIFMKDRFGFDIIKTQWEKMPEMRAINAINSSLFEQGTSFGSELNKFGIWTFYTGYRTIQGEYFEEAANYPEVSPSDILDFTSSSVNVTMNAHPTSNNFIDFVDRVKGDTLTVLVTNTDYINGVNNTQNYYPFTYYVYDYNEPGSQQLTGVYYSKIVTNQPSAWTSSEFFNNYLIREGEIPLEISDYAFPNPFRYSTNDYIIFPVKSSGGSDASLNVYTSAMELIFSVTKPFDYLSGQRVMKWNGLDNKNQRVPSGVYIYITLSGSEKKIGKLVIFNE